MLSLHICIYIYIYIYTVSLCYVVVLLCCLLVFSTLLVFCILLCYQFVVLWLCLLIRRSSMSASSSSILTSVRPSSCTYMYIYIYIYIEREREIDRYMYIYIYIERERDILYCVVLYCVVWCRIVSLLLRRRLPLGEELLPLHGAGVLGHGAWGASLLHMWLFFSSANSYYFILDILVNCSCSQPRSTGCLAYTYTIEFQKLTRYNVLLPGITYYSLGIQLLNFT